MEAVLRPCSQARGANEGNRGRIEVQARVSPLVDRVEKAEMERISGEEACDKSGSGDCT